MPKGKKKVNPLVTERINECIKDSGKSGRWICRNVLTENGVVYSSSNFSKFTTGAVEPPKWIMQKLSVFFNVRLEWLSGMDDFKTPNEQIKFALQEIGRIAIDSETPKKLERMSRIAELSDVFQKLQEVYGVPNDWSEKSLAEGFAFIAYLDEQIEHAFKTYFKYFDPSDISEEQSEKIDNVIDGVEQIINNTVQHIKAEFPEGMTEGQFSALMRSKENQKKAKCTLPSDGRLFPSELLRELHF